MQVCWKVAAAAALASTAACVSMGPDYSTDAVAQLKPGTPKEEVIALLGRPTTIVTLPDGRQQLMWVHSRGTMLGSAQARSALLMFSATGEYIGTMSQAETTFR